MRRFLTLVCFLCLAVPAGVMSISGCTRNPQEDYCNGLGYGPKVTDVASLTLTPQVGGISLAYGQNQQIASPSAKNCNGSSASVAGQYQYGTTNNQLVDISPSGNMCAGTWNRNSGGDKADYTTCSPPNPPPSTGGLPYGSAYITATISSVVSNPVQVFVHAPVTSVSLVGPSSCLSQSQSAQLDSLAYYSSNGTQALLCQPAATAVVSGYSVNANVVTLTASNSFVAGERVTFSGLSSATFLNNQTYTVLDAGLSGTQFEIAATATDSGSTPDSGTATTTTSNPVCENSIGTMSFTVGTPAVATVNSTTNQITAQLPGTTAITATLAGSGSTAGYFSTCPPASIAIALNGNSTGPITVTKGVTQNLTTTVVDTNSHSISGLALDYQSTNPIDISASGGAIAPNFPGQASIFAICQPPSCNPAPINQIGVSGTGLPIASNALPIVVPGTASEYVWLGAPGQSQYIVNFDLLTGTTASNVRLPYVPNSMVMDQGGNNIYLGSDRGLMTVSTSGNSVATPISSLPGVVLAVAPSGTELLINDQGQQVFYIYNSSTSSTTTFSGMGAAAAWSSDSKTLYIVDSASLGGKHTDTFYTYNQSVWKSCTAGVDACAAAFTGAQNLAPQPQQQPNLATVAPFKSLAVTTPGVGAYLAGDPTVSRTWCPTGTAGGTLSYYPQGDLVNARTDVLAATADGDHILGATAGNGSISLSDIGVTIPTTQCNGANSGTLSPPLSTNPVLFGSSIAIPGVTAAAYVNQIVPSPSSNASFITYTPQASAPANNNLPYYLTAPNYLTASSGAGTTGDVTLMNGSSPSTTVTAPLAGAFSPDNKLFFVSTAGDNLLHVIGIPDSITSTSLPTDTQQLTPNLPACEPLSAGGVDPGCIYSGSGTVVPATVIVVKPRSTT